LKEKGLKVPDLSRVIFEALDMEENGVAVDDTDRVDDDDGLGTQAALCSLQGVAGGVCGGREEQRMFWDLSSVFIDGFASFASTAKISRTYLELINRGLLSSCIVRISVGLTEMGLCWPVHQECSDYAQ
jgi:hypothetical protein